MSRSSSKSMAALFDFDEELPTDCPQVFENKQFILTKGEGFNTNYHKGYMQEIIQCHGGTVIDLENGIENTADTYLIADRPYCTMAYIGALSLNIPPISYRWIVDCVRGRVLENFENYRIPAGYINGEAIPFKPTSNVLKGLSIGVYDHCEDDKIFSTFFEFVINNMGGVFVSLPTLYTDVNEVFQKPEQKCDYVLIRKRCRQGSIVTAATEMHVIPVYPEWMLYAIFNRKVDYSSQYHATLETECATNSDSESESDTSTDSDFSSS